MVLIRKFRSNRETGRNMQITEIDSRRKWKSEEQRDKISKF